MLAYLIVISKLYALCLRAAPAHWTQVDHPITELHKGTSATISLYCTLTSKDTNFVLYFNIHKHKLCTVL